MIFDGYWMDGRLATFLAFDGFQSPCNFDGGSTP
jgi:hypothetical protein